MYAGYYKKTVEYDGKADARLVRLDDDCKAYLYSRIKGDWVESEANAFVWEDTDYDKITEAEANDLIAKWKKG